MAKLACVTCLVLFLAGLAAAELDLGQKKTIALLKAKEASWKSSLASVSGYVLRKQRRSVFIPRKETSLHNVCQRKRPHQSDSAGSKGLLGADEASRSPFPISGSDKASPPSTSPLFGDVEASKSPEPFGRDEASPLFGDVEASKSPEPLGRDEASKSPIPLHPSEEAVVDEVAVDEVAMNGEAQFTAQLFEAISSFKVLAAPLAKHLMGADKASRSSFRPFPGKLGGDQASRPFPGKLGGDQASRPVPGKSGARKHLIGGHHEPRPDPANFGDDQPSHPSSHHMQLPDMTMKSLFRMIKQIVMSGICRAAVQFHEELSYPTTVDFYNCRALLGLKVRFIVPAVSSSCFMV